MEVHTSAKRIRVAISGGGLAGAILANALQKYAHLEVNIYESSGEFSERGAAVGLSINAQSALSEIGSEARNALELAGAVEMHSTRQMIASGENAGTMLYDLNGAGTLVVHRAALLREFLKPIPAINMHVNKKLVKIQDGLHGETGILLSFEDGTVKHADVLIGADGIHSYVRKYILGAEHPTANAKFAGFWDCRSLVPFEKAKQFLGEEYFKENRQYAWIGDGGFMMHDVLDNGKTVQCVAAVFVGGNSGWDADEWKKPIDREILEEVFASWKDGPITRGMIELLLDNPEPTAFAEYHHLDTPDYAKGHVCMMGDAAHAMTPWQGSGAGQAIEDAMILEILLTNIQDASQLTAALQAYDTVRRPRAQRVVASSQGTGVIMCGSAPEVELNPEKLISSLGARWEFIHALDMKIHKAEAISIMNELVSAEEVGLRNEKT